MRGKVSVEGVVERACEVMALMRQKPRTIADVARETKIGQETARRYVSALRDSGNAYVSCHRPNPRGSATPVYAWQPEPFHHDDAPLGRWEV